VLGPPITWPPLTYRAVCFPCYQDSKSLALWPSGRSIVERAI